MNTFFTQFCIVGAFAGALLFVAPAAHAQQPAAATAPAPAATGRITGVVLDSANRQPVPYATVVLLPADAAATKPLTGVAADGEGRFTLEKIAAGTYRVRAQYVGYAPITRPVTVADGNGAVVDAGTFSLPTTAAQLADVVIEGQKPVVEVKPDRLIYNADQDVTNAGGTAADVLRKAPLLSVDGDGNPKMRGSSNFRVLVNNKPSPTLAANLAEALKAIPADQIKSIEVITTPPAKYDGEGTAGIINIVLKKGVDRGLNGSIGASGGNRNTNANLSLNGKKGKVGVSSWLGAGQWFGPSRGTRTRTDRDSSGAFLGQLTQRAQGRFGGGWFYGSLGVDYDPADNHSLSLAASANGWGGDNQQDAFNQYQAPDAARNQLFTRATTSVFGGFNGELTGTYTRTFKDQPRREWSVLGQAASNTGTFGFDFDQYASATAGPVNEATYRETSRGKTPGAEYTAQTDYTHPFGKDAKMTLETGLKAIWRHTGSVADVRAFTAGQTTDFVLLPDRRTDFEYDQQVQAAYATYSFGLGKKTSVSLGGRGERTTLQGDFRVTDTRFTQNYFNLLPTGSVQYAFSDKTSARAVYSRRISRPFIDYLNPFVDRSDSLNLVFGNPTLNPELTDSYELSYNTLIKEATLNISASVRRTDNAIELIRRATDVPGVTASTFANVAANAFYQLNFYGSVKPLKDWELSGGPNLQYVTRRSPALGIRSRDGFTASVNLNTSYKLTKLLQAQAFGSYSLPDPQLQGEGAAWLWYSVGIKQKLLKERADLSVNLANPFNDYWAFRNTLETTTITERADGRSYQRAIRVGFTWRFGEAQQGRQRKSVSNDDKKGGGGGGGQGGGGQ